MPLFINLGSGKYAILRTDFWQKNRLSVDVSDFASWFAFLDKATTKNVQQFLHGVPKTGVPNVLKVTFLKPNKLK